MRQQLALFRIFHVFRNIGIRLLADNQFRTLAVERIAVHIKDVLDRLAIRRALIIAESLSLRRPRYVFTGTCKFRRANPRAIDVSRHISIEPHGGIAHVAVLSVNRDNVVLIDQNSFPLRLYHVVFLVLGNLKRVVIHARADFYSVPTFIQINMNIDDVILISGRIRRFLNNNRLGIFRIDNIVLPCGRKIIRIRRAGRLNALLIKFDDELFVVFLLVFQLLIRRNGLVAELNLLVLSGIVIGYNLLFGRVLLFYRIVVRIDCLVVFLNRRVVCVDRRICLLDRHAFRIRLDRHLRFSRKLRLALRFLRLVERLARLLFDLLGSGGFLSRHLFRRHFFRRNFFLCVLFRRFSLLRHHRSFLRHLGFFRCLHRFLNRFRFFGFCHRHFRHLNNAFGCHDFRCLSRFLRCQCTCGHHRARHRHRHSRCQKLFV